MKKSRKVLVAGGSTGIGAAVVRALRARGDDVVLVDKNASDGKAVVSEKALGKAHFIESDLSAAETPAMVIDEAIKWFDGRLDGIFYNAGLLKAAPLNEWTVGDWDKTVAVNLRGPFLMVQAAERALASSESGRVVLTSSTGAFRGHAGMPAYHATKAGLLGLVRSLADELGASGTTVNAICPGWVDTPFNEAFWGHQDDSAAALRDLEQSIPLKRQALPDEIVGSVLFLLGQDAGYITGQALVADGGYTAI